MSEHTAVTIGKEMAARLTQWMEERNKFCIVSLASNVEETAGELKADDVERVGFPEARKRRLREITQAMIEASHEFVTCEKDAIKRMIEHMIASGQTHPKALWESNGSPERLFQRLDEVWQARISGLYHDSRCVASFPANEDEHNAAIVWGKMLEMTEYNAYLSAVDEAILLTRDEIDVREWWAKKSS